jgi:hypothetical protein
MLNEQMLFGAVLRGLGRPGLAAGKIGYTLSLVGTCLIIHVCRH